MNTLDRTIETLGGQLMASVVRSGCIRYGSDADYALAVNVMRQEMKAFIIADEDKDGKYVDERALALQGSGLAMVSLVAECIRRILAERAN